MNIYRSLPILFILTILYGCKNDVPILAEKKEIPIVYCVLNPRDSVNYIRINRSSQDINNTHEFEYPGEIIVSMQEFGTNNYYAFEMTESFNKEIKAIPFDTKYIFKTNTLVLPKNRYALNIYFPELDITLQAETFTLDYFSILEPNPEITRTIDFATDPFYKVQWLSCKDALIYQTYIHFLYDEIHGLDTIRQKIIYKNSYISANVNLSDFIYTDNVYSEPFIIYVGETIEKNANVQRKCIGVVFEIVAGNEDLALFLENIYSDINLNNINLVSNIENGIGIFCSAFSEFSDTLELSGNTIDSISFGQFTKGLNFKDRWGNIH